MSWFILICISNFISTNSFILQDTYNVLLKDNADYKVDLIITEDDYEMIDKNQLKEFEIEHEKEKFGEFYKMARKAYQTSTKIKSKKLNLTSEAVKPMVPVVSGNHKYNNTLTTKILEPTEVTTGTSMKKYVQKINITYDYDYLVNEYYDEANNDSRSNNTYHIGKSVNEISKYDVIHLLKRIFMLTNDYVNCSDVNGIGLWAVKCLLDDYSGQRQTMGDVVARLWRIFQIWFLVYLAVAIPLWCTRGWCCCCLCCKFFKPRQTIEEAKKYIVLYPPGVFKTKNGDIQYEPSEREKECYEEVEHFIKTL